MSYDGSSSVRRAVGLTKTPKSPGSSDKTFTDVESPTYTGGGALIMSEEKSFLKPIHM